MRDILVSQRLDKKLIRMKDQRRRDAIFKKMDEIAAVDNIDHYKTLRHPMQHLKRVHIDNSFVLTFRLDRDEDAIVFMDIDHHDRIYRQ